MRCKNLDGIQNLINRFKFYKSFSLALTGVGEFIPVTVLEWVTDKIFSNMKISSSIEKFIIQ